MFSRITAVLAGLVAVTRGPDSRRLDIRRVAVRHRHQDEFDDLAHDSRLEHQERADNFGGSR